MTSSSLQAVPRPSTRPTWAEISLAALRANFRAVQKHVGERVAVCAVVKADAYGHTAAPCALALESEGARWLGVTTTDEGVPLRTAGVRGRILLLSGFWRGDEEEVIHQKLTATVWESWHVEALNRAAERLGAPPQPVHLKVDTGMARLGVKLEDLPSMCRMIRRCTHVSLEGLFTHFASAEVLDASETAQQIDSFERALSVVRSQGLTPSLCHMDNSAAVLSHPETWKNMVRPGIALYGYALPQVRNGKPVHPSAVLPLRPALSWKTRILSIKEVGLGQALGYNGTYVTTTPSRIAALPVGYADGYSRALSNRGRVIVRGAYAPIVGSVSMDLTLVDVTAVPDADVGDEVHLLGSSGSLAVDAAELARLSGTVPYEILCAISKRVPRVHLL